MSNIITELAFCKEQIPTTEDIKYECFKWIDEITGEPKALYANYPIGTKWLICDSSDRYVLESVIDGKAVWKIL